MSVTDPSEAEANAKPAGELRYHLISPNARSFGLILATVFFAALALFAVFLAYPDSPPEWKARPLERTAPAILFAALIYFLLSLNRVTQVCPQSRQIVIWRYTLFVVPWWRQRIAFTQVTSVACATRANDMGQVLWVSLITDDERRILVMHRYRPHEFNDCRRQAQQLAGVLSVPCQGA